MRTTFGGICSFISKLYLKRKLQPEQKFSVTAGNSYRRGRLNAVCPPSTNWFRSAAFDNANIIHFFFTKQATLMRRSIVMSLPST